MPRRPPTPERVFYHRPAEHIVRPPDFPPRADPWNEVHNPRGTLVDPLRQRHPRQKKEEGEEEDDKDTNRDPVSQSADGSAYSGGCYHENRDGSRSWGPYPTPSDMALAFHLWSLPDGELEYEVFENESVEEDRPRTYAGKRLRGGARTRPAHRRELARGDGQGQAQAQAQSQVPASQTVDELVEEARRKQEEEDEQQRAEIEEQTRHIERIAREKPIRPLDFDEENDGVMEVLGRNVYEHLLQNWLLPPADEDLNEDAQMKVENGVRANKVGWTWEEIFYKGSQAVQQQGGQEEQESGDEGQKQSRSPVVEEEGTETESVKLNNHDVLMDRFWTIKRLKKELSKRKQDTNGNSMVLRRRLNDLVKNENGTQKTKKEAKIGSQGNRGGNICLLPLTELSHWEMPRREDCIIKVSPETRLTPLDMYTWAIQLSPYNPTYWVSRAYLFYQMGYFDLALGDTHRALLLCEVLYDNRTRTRQPGLYPRIWHSVEGHISQLDKNADGKHVKKLRGPNGINYFIPILRRTIHHITSLGLLKLECWDDYKAMEMYLPQRLLMAYHFKSPFENRLAAYLDMIDGPRGAKLADRMFFEDHYGKVSGKQYPFRANDIDRTSKPFLSHLNSELFTKNRRLPWKRCEIRAKKDDPGNLGVFATTNIESGQIIYADEPSMKGCLYLHLPTDARSGRNYIPQRCEHCRRKLEHRNWLVETDRNRCSCTLEDEMIRFCPAPSKPSSKSCLEIAKELYHFRTCGSSWRWLYEGMRPTWNTWRNADEKNPSYYTHNNEQHGTTLSLLLREVFDTTLHRREQNKNPNLLAHELDELLPLEGESQWKDDHFPFSLAANIRVPFDILMALGVDIFRDLTFDTWIIQLVLRKLLLAAVPWDHDRRHDNEDEENYSEKVLPERQVQLKRLDLPSFFPTIKDFGLYPGLAMFNHRCLHESRNNAWWGYDNKLPNRVLVWASRPIQKGDEITIPYSNQPFDKCRSIRTLGRPCNCGLNHQSIVTKRDGRSDQSLQSFKTEPFTSFEDAVVNSLISRGEGEAIPPSDRLRINPSAGLTSAPAPAPRPANERLERPDDQSVVVITDRSGHRHQQELPSRKQKRSAEQESDSIEILHQRPVKRSRTGASTKKPGEN